MIRAVDTIPPAIIAWTPLFDPINAVFTWWFLLAPVLAFGVAMIYKAMRVPNVRSYWRQVAVLTMQIVLGMIVLALCLFALTEWIVPLLPAE